MTREQKKEYKANKRVFHALDRVINSTYRNRKCLTEEKRQGINEKIVEAFNIVCTKMDEYQTQWKAEDSERIEYKTKRYNERLLERQKEKFIFKNY